MTRLSSLITIALATAAGLMALLGLTPAAIGLLVAAVFAMTFDP